MRMVTELHFLHFKLNMRCYPKPLRIYVEVCEEWLVKQNGAKVLLHKAFVKECSRWLHLFLCFRFLYVARLQN